MTRSSGRIRVTHYHYDIGWLLAGNPLEERYAMEGIWRDEAVKRLPNIKRLDGAPVIHWLGIVRERNTQLYTPQLT